MYVLYHIAHYNGHNFIILFFDLDLLQKSTEFNCLICINSIFSISQKYVLKLMPQRYFEGVVNFEGAIN